MDLPLKDKVVLVTGAAKRIGEAITRHLHARGAKVFLHYRQETKESQALLHALNALRPGSASAMALDLAHTSRLPELADAVLAAFGRLDALVNNASAFFPSSWGEIKEEMWDKLFSPNLRAPFFLAQAAAKSLEASQGCIVNITDIHAERPLRHYPLYTISKAGLAGLTRALAVEMAPRVRVNAVAPGAILWPEDPSHFPEDEQEKILERVLLGRAGHPSDIARAVYFFLAEAPYVTGQVLAVDGGRSLSA